MKKKFTKKLARKIADQSFCYMLDCVMGYSDSGYSLNTFGEEFEQNFEEDLEELGITATSKRLKIIVNYYDKRQAKATAIIESWF